MSGVSNEQILSAIMSLKQDMGGVQAVAKNAHEYAGAVSKKADIIREEMIERTSEVERSVNDHKKDPEAHGIQAEKRGWGALQAGLGAILGALVAVIAILKFLAPLAKASGQ